ncbi:hypothetical protein IAT38_008221 [Cryptococcus sp. DSM 104549]
MLASSSKILGRSTVAASRTFSTTSAVSSRRQTYVELLQDVRGLGSQFDRLLVSPGRARNELIPLRKARFIPWKVTSDRETFRTSVDSGAASNAFQIEAPGVRKTQQRAAFKEPATSKQELLNSLFTLPSTLTFHLRTVSPHYPALHGSLTLSEVHDRLDKEFGLPSKAASVSWVGQDMGSRMKELGTWQTIVKLRKGGREEVPMAVEVVRLVEEEQK